MLKLFVSQDTVDEAESNPFLLADEMDNSIKVYLREFNVPAGDLNPDWLDIYHARTFVKYQVNGFDPKEFFDAFKYDSRVFDQISRGLGKLGFPLISEEFQLFTQELKTLGSELQTNFDAHGNLLSEQVRLHISGFHERFHRHYDDQKFQAELPRRILGLDEVEIVPGNQIRYRPYICAIAYHNHDTRLRANKLVGQHETFMERYSPVNFQAASLRTHNTMTALCLNGAPRRRYDGMIWDGRSSDVAHLTSGAGALGRARRKLKALAKFPPDLRHAVLQPPYAASTKVDRSDPPITYYRINTGGMSCLVCDNGASLTCYEYENFEIGRLLATLDLGAYGHAISLAREQDLPRSLLLLIDRDWQSEHLVGICPLLPETGESGLYEFETKRLSDEGDRLTTSHRYLKATAKKIEIYEDAELSRPLSEVQTSQLGEEWASLKTLFAQRTGDLTPLLA